MRSTRFDQAGRRQTGPHAGPHALWQTALHSAARGGATAAIGVATYLCGLAALVLIGAFVLAACPPDLSPVADLINKTNAYTDGGTPGATDATRLGAAPAAEPETTGSIAAPDTIHRIAAPGNAACGASEGRGDSPCGPIAARAGALPTPAQPPLRGSF